MGWFNKVSERHNEYIKIVQSFPENANNNCVEDIVQDAYIELTELGTKKHKEGDKRVNPKYKDLPICKRVLNNEGQVNMIYIWITLKRVSMNHLKERLKKKTFTIRLGEGFDMADIDGSENVQAYNKVMEKIEAETMNWHWYDRMLFDTYLKDGRSMRKLSEETGISVTSVFTTLRNCKERIRLNCGEDYTDYLNKDYELI